MAKKIFYDDEARTRLLAGAEALYKGSENNNGSTWTQCCY